ncbi:MAG: tRNA preQ1(34) S-adenosylmethionine ribosyltransferase-isomerase QueA [Acidobacteriota bacterium]|nr:tRNA preQ1(34) S-adenosylmethionine ribosyltransferase-isomerase QueA [Acidobacteriota bacterium]MDH3785860.1 tRNA preQ1(34) S-adenosylmethionine ribosyltransferase-isomerase QueA [Acidobacteriota bacterium]
MNVDDFSFDLPSSLIAQRPLQRRDASRLMLLGRGDGSVIHRTFDKLPSLLRSGDLLVFNDTKVLPTRLYATKESGGRVELLLIEPDPSTGDDRVWRAWMRASRKPAVGSALRLADGTSVEVLDPDRHGPRVRFGDTGASVLSILEESGRMPLPPYIDRGSDESDDEDRDRYQTVFARSPGAVAAPTAGLHFSRELLGRLEDAGVARATVTLHVGPGTFQPVRVTRVEDHRMHGERYTLSESTAEQIRKTRSEGGRVVAVGTTVVRTLESCIDESGEIRHAEGRSELFVYPGFRFRAVDAMITNFHLPSSTLLMLVSAFAGRESVLAAYREAIDHEYRFFSYGDGMLIQ